MSTHAETGDHDRETTATGCERVTVRDTDGQLEAIDALVDAGQFPNRSETIREAIRQLVASATERDSDA